MVKYNHYGIEVTRQTLDEDTFTNVLTKNGITYIDLPILSNDYDVITYKKDNVTKFAVIRPLVRPEECAENVYITDSIPVDLSFDNLILDIDAQADGAEPMQRKTKLKLAIEQAINNVYTRQEALDNIFADPTVTEPDFAEIKQELHILGYDRDRILKAEKYDVDKSYIEKLLS